jgi:hypothetical protein
MLRRVQQLHQVEPLLAIPRLVYTRHQEQPLVQVWAALLVSTKSLRSSEQQMVLAPEVQRISAK